jgi:Xaa-Pro aminopeptidase
VSTWDEGIPDDIPHDNLFGITWNPGNLLAWVRSIEGATDGRRVGTDSLTPRFARLLPKVFPSAELVDAGPLLQAARRVKTPEEIAAIQAAVRTAETALVVAVAELRPGVTERHLTAAFMDAMAREGVTTPATQRVARIATSRHGDLDGDGLVQKEDLVAFDAAVVAAGYAGEVGRTWPASPAAVDGRTEDLYRRADELWAGLLAACRPGAPCSDLLAAYQAVGEALPPIPVATGLGLGFDVPLVSRDLPRTAADERLDPGMVLAVSANVTGDGANAVVRKEAVLITTGGAEILTSSPRWQKHER